MRQAFAVKEKHDSEADSDWLKSGLAQNKVKDLKYSSLADMHFGSKSKMPEKSLKQKKEVLNQHPPYGFPCRPWI